MHFPSNPSLSGLPPNLRNHIGGYLPPEDKRTLNRNTCTTLRLQDPYDAAVRPVALELLARLGTVTTLAEFTAFLSETLKTIPVRQGGDDNYRRLILRKLVDQVAKLPSEGDQSKAFAALREAAREGLDSTDRLAVLRKMAARISKLEVLPEKFEAAYEALWDECLLLADPGPVYKELAHALPLLPAEKHATWFKRLLEDSSDFDSPCSRKTEIYANLSEVAGNFKLPFFMKCIDSFEALLNAFEQFGDKKSPDAVKFLRTLAQNLPRLDGLARALRFQDILYFAKQLPNAIDVYFILGQKIYSLYTRKEDDESGKIAPEWTLALYPTKSAIRKFVNDLKNLEGSESVYREILQVSPDANVAEKIKGMPPMCPTPLFLKTLDEAISWKENKHRLDLLPHQDQMNTNLQQNKVFEKAESMFSKALAPARNLSKEREFNVSIFLAEKIMEALTEKEPRLSTVITGNEALAKR